MNIVTKTFQVIGKVIAYSFVFMVNPKAVIFREVDDELEKDDGEKPTEKKN